MSSSSNILQPSHLSQINNALTSIATAEKEIALAKMAGIDVTSNEQLVSNAKAKLLKLKNVYFPNG